MRATSTRRDARLAIPIDRLTPGFDATRTEHRVVAGRVPARRDAGPRRPLPAAPTVITPPQLPTEMAVSDDAIADWWPGHWQAAVGTRNPGEAVGRPVGHAVAYDTASPRPRDPATDPR